MIQMKALRYTHLHMDSQVGIRVINHAWETIERSPLESRLRTLLPWEPFSLSGGSPWPSKMADGTDPRTTAGQSMSLYQSILADCLCNFGLLPLPSLPTVSASRAIISSISATVSAILADYLCPFELHFSGLTPRYQGRYISPSAWSLKTSLSKRRNQTKKLVSEMLTAAPSNK